MADNSIDTKRGLGRDRGGLRRYTARRVLTLLVVLAVVLLALSLYASDSSFKAGLAAWVSGVLSNLGAGIVGSCVTFSLIDMRLNRRREEEARLEEARIRAAQEARDDEQRRLALIALVRSQNINYARSAIEELRLRGWLSDGSLKGVDFSAANLRGLNFSGANILGAIFRGADLRDTDFSGADLRRCNFEMADLRGWRVAHALVEGADFTSASRD